MKEAFEIEWLGGPAEHHFRRARPGIEDLPWGTLDPSKYPPLLVDSARARWTDAAFAEYKAVAAFAEVLRTLCEARAPLDLIGMASSFVADEAVHTEMCSRVAMELGGGVNRPVDYAELVVKPDPSLTPLQRASELVLRVSCIAERFSERMAVRVMQHTTHPLTRAVYEKIVADESMHTRLGGLYFDWVAEDLEDAERARLAKVAMETLRAFEPFWKQPPPKNYEAAHEPRRLAQIHELGWIEHAIYVDRAHETVLEGIVAPLASYGIELPKEEVASLVAPFEGA